MDFVQVFNAIEAVWWTVLGLTLLVVPIRHRAFLYRKSLSAILVVFGISDFVELWSGAWWRPWWLAVTKS